MQKQIVMSILFSFGIIGIQAQENQMYQEKVKTVDATIESLYAVISGEKGEARDWDLFKFLFAKDAKLIPTRKSKEGNIYPEYMTPADYQERSGKWLIENGFHEKELFRVTESFGNICHAFSTYESYRSKNDESPFARGINSIQLMNDGNRWWIINIYWTPESESNPIPGKYLPK